MNINWKDVVYFAQQYADAHAFLLPIGIIGLWRWGVWLGKEIFALFYRPQTVPYEAKVSLVTPVYNEDPEFFLKALRSWQANGPSEIIAVIDYTDESCIAVFQQFAKECPAAHLIVTQIPGKRPALAEGIKAATGTIVVLVDSDTLWDGDVQKNGLCPFRDPRVAGVATYQSVYEPQTFAQKIFDTQLDLRYKDEFPFLAVAGDALICLSGRTAFYRREIVLPMCDDLINETFLGQKVISGDDKRLTYLVLAAGWKVAYQSNSHVYTPGMADMRSFFNQRLRWSRNALRADIRALGQRWVWRRPALVFFQIDKFFQSLVVILSPIYFCISVYMGLWSAALLIFIWWFVSRTIKMYPHLRRRPQDITILPGFILYSFFSGLLRMYAFFTLNTQGWITRWDQSRLPQFRVVQVFPAYAATCIVIILLSLGVSSYKQQSYFVPRSIERQLIALALPPARSNTKMPTEKPVDLTSRQKDLLVKRYVVRTGDSLSEIATDHGITLETMLAANMSKITNWNNLEVGMVLSIPGRDTELTPQNRFNYQRVYPDPLQVTYDPGTESIVISGRGQKVNLAGIRDRVGEEYLKEISPKVWYLTATIFVHSGVTLNLDKSEVSWLQMESRPRKFVVLRTFSADVLINGVKVTSWDEDKKDYDKNMRDGRSYILVKDGSRLDIYDSELAYLGYPRTAGLNASPYGVSWRMSNGKLGTTLLTGEVIKSKFHHNYFGNFTFGATGMTWRGNEAYENTRYGFDPHDDSNGFLFEKNIAHHNGTHGFILSKRCLYTVFRDNISYANKLHGIMLHEKSNFNVIVDNDLYDNQGGGVVLWRSSDNLIYRNNLYGNKYGWRANVSSNDNILMDNTIMDSKSYGVYLYADANNNTIQDNTFTGNGTAVYIKSNHNVILKNKLEDNAIGVYFIGKATDNIVSRNSIRYHTSYGVYSKSPSSQIHNTLGTNSFYRNRKDVLAQH